MAAADSPFTDIFLSVPKAVMMILMTGSTVVYLMR